MKKYLFIIAMLATVAVAALIYIQTGLYSSIELQRLMKKTSNKAHEKRKATVYKRPPENPRNASAGGFPKGLRIRFDRDDNPSAGQKYFFDIPQSAAGARAAGWKRAFRPSFKVLPQLIMYCPADKVLCPLYDDTGYIAGLQVAVSKVDFTKNVFDWTKRGFTTWNTTVLGVRKTFWTIQQYFVSEEFLQKSKAERLASRDSSRLLQAGAVWVVGTDNALKRISTREDDIIQDGLFTKQSCITWMGQHYYHNMSSATECTAEQMYPWFLMTRNSTLIASGFLTYGTLDIPVGERDWYEHPGLATVKQLIPDGPKCLYDMAVESGTVTMHMYYIDQPWTVEC